MAQKDSEEITEEEVREFLAILNQATKDQDVEKVLEYLVPFSYSKITLTSGSDLRSFELNTLADHRLYLEEQVKAIQSSEDTDNYVQIKISADGKVAFFNQKETSTITLTDGRRMLVVSEGKGRIARVDGKLRLISWEQTADVDLRPSTN